MDYLNSLGGKFKEATGNVAKAYLCVRDPSGFEVSTEENLAEKHAKESSETLKAILKEAEKKLSGARGSLGSMITDNSSKGLSLQQIANAVNGTYVPIQVQYNPNSIRMRSDPGGRRRITAIEGVGSAGEGQSIKELPKSTELSCTLIIEKVNVNDAFIQASEGWNASIGNITSTIGDAYKKISGSSGSEPYSVRKDVEGILALLNTEYTRDVIFFYGRMCFHGEIVNANATYKMFNKNGDPIYAEVTIRIRQGDSLSEDDNKRWDDAYNKLFSSNESDAVEDNSTWGKVKKVAGNTYNGITDVFSGGIF